jgi:hypothetical protein
MEVFLVADTYFNLNLEIFAETRPNRQQLCTYIYSRYRKHNYESKMNLLCSEVNIILR